MKKIPTLFVRDQKTKRAINEVSPGCEWVIRGEGSSSRKFDGTCCMIRGGRLFKRYDARAAQDPVTGEIVTSRPLPPGFEACEPAPDPVTGHYPGWVPVGDGPEDRWHREALVIDGSAIGEVLMCCDVDAAPDGTYELCGPKVQGNPEGFISHVLVPHGKAVIPGCPADFDGLKVYLEESHMEGIVWHHPDGRAAKLKRRDYGLKWPI